MLRRMEIPVTVARGIRHGFQNVIRESGWGTSLASLFGVLLLSQMLLFVVIGLEGGILLLQEKTDLRLEILENASDAQIQDLYQNLRSLPYVDDVVYITREQAYERVKQRDPKLLEFVTKFGIENPFPETMGVRLKQLSDYGMFVEFLRQPVFSSVVDPNFLSTTTDQEDQVRRVLELTFAAHTGALFGMGLLFLVLLFIVVELIRRRALLKREELFVEQLVGASRTTILLPFFTEVCMLLAFALFLSAVLAGGIVFLIPLALPSLGSGGIFQGWVGASTHLLLRLLPSIAFVEVLLVPTLGLLGTVFAFRDQLSLITRSSRLS